MENEQIQIARHSMAHVLAKALKQIYPNVKLAFGPAISNGCYYDVELEDNITEEDFKTIEKAMTAIINKAEVFERKEVSKQEALELFKDEPFKIEHINELAESEQLSVYFTGNDFYDLCRGPHLEKTSKLANWGFKVDKVNGAYWKGDAKNKMLKRIYVLAFPTKKELFDYVKLMEEAQKRDHRKLGQDLDLFFISDYAKGMPFFMANGVTIMNELISYWREIHRKAGYEEIITPLAMNRELWEISGHWTHYKKNMYTFKVEEEDFAVKPMNCPGGMIYYKNKMRSYRDLPLRVGELGKVHRHEASGTLHGLFRVRCFTQDDAHIFMTPNQIEDEVANVVKLVDEAYATFGLTDYHFELSTMPEDHIGDVEDWQRAETALANALKKMGRDYVVNEGDGAFYGPKIDIHVKDAIGRTWQCGTIQLDMQLPKRFELEYIDADGSKKEPIMIHRVVFGSIERFFGIITENFAGAFPVWLTPVQVTVMNIAESTSDYANEIYNKLSNFGFRVKLDVRNEKIGYKIRESASKKIPYMIVVGDKEKEENKITVRMRGNKELSGITLDEFIDRLHDKINNKRLDV